MKRTTDTLMYDERGIERNCAGDDGLIYAFGDDGPVRYEVMAPLEGGSPEFVFADPVRDWLRAHGFTSENTRVSRLRQYKAICYRSGSYGIVFHPEQMSWSPPCDASDDTAYGLLLTLVQPVVPWATGKTALPPFQQYPLPRNPTADWVRSYLPASVQVTPNPNPSWESSDAAILAEAARKRDETSSAGFARSLRVTCPSGHEVGYGEDTRLPEHDGAQGPIVIIAALLRFNNSMPLLLSCGCTVTAGWLEETIKSRLVRMIHAFTLDKSKWAMKFKDTPETVHVTIEPKEGVSDL